MYILNLVYGDLNLAFISFISFYFRYNNGHFEFFLYFVYLLVILSFKRTINFSIYCSLGRFLSILLVFGLF